MLRITRFLTLTLALLFAVTSVHMAQARGLMASAAGSFVLCTGQGTEIVMPDRSGAPMGIVHSCPDCIITLALEHSVPDAGEPQSIHIHTIAQVLDAKAALALIPSLHPARGPPQMI